MRTYGSRPKDQLWCFCYDRWRCPLEKKSLKRIWRKRARRENSHASEQMG